MTSANMKTSLELTVAINAARKAEQILSSYFSDLASAEIRTKYTNEEFQGIVTKADIEAERAIVNEIQSALPNHHFRAEEEHSRTLQCEHLWVIDPLDGTLPFIESVPGYSVSIALVSRSGDPVFGVIHDPVTDSGNLPLSVRMKFNTIESNGFIGKSGAGPEAGR